MNQYSATDLDLISLLRQRHHL